MRPTDILTAYVDDYFATVASLSYDELAVRQDGSHATVGYGAAGVAYACWRGAHALGRPDLLEVADRLSGAALARQHDRLALLSAGAPSCAAMPTSSIVFGRAGLYQVHALIAHDRGHVRRRRQAVTRFLQAGGLPLARPDAPAADAANPALTALYTGSAGVLAATAFLLAQTGDGRLRSAGDGLADHLLAAAATDAGGAAAWQSDGDLGLAHGDAGVYLALLLWSAANGRSLPPGFTPSLTAFLHLLLAEPGRFNPRPDHAGFLCNGFAGIAVLAAAACRILGGAPFLGLAQRAARRALQHPPPRPDLCCGRAGLVAAALALDAVDPEGPWRSQAVDLLLSTLLCEAEDWSFSGLYGGEAALPVLALALLAGASPLGLPALGA